MPLRDAQRLRSIALSILVLLAPGVVLSQGSFATETFGDRPFSPFRPRRAGPPPPPIRLRVELSVALTGPALGLPPALEDGAVRVFLESGVAIVKLDDGTARTVEGVPPPSVEDPEWLRAGPESRRRFRVEPGDPPVLIAERRARRKRDRWKPAWKLRVPGLATPPLVLEDRLFLGSRDNRVFGLRTRNGHRVWSQDVGDRVVAPLTLWRAQIVAPVAGQPSSAPAQTQSVNGLLVVPEDGHRLLVLDPFDGRKLASLEIPGADSRAEGRALATDDGRIVLMVRGYAPEDLSILIVRAEAAPAASGAAEPSPEGAAPSP